MHILSWFVGTGGAPFGHWLGTREMEVESLPPPPASDSCPMLSSEDALVESHSSFCPFVGNTRNGYCENPKCAWRNSSEAGDDAEAMQE